MFYVTDERLCAVVVIEDLGPGTGWATLHSGPVNGSDFLPAGLCRLPAGLAVADRQDDRVVLFSTDGDVLDVLDPAGSPVGALRAPRAVAPLGENGLLIADEGNGRVVFCADVGDLDWQVLAGFQTPTGVAADPDGAILVADPAARALVRFDDASGTGRTELTLPAAAVAPRPYGVTTGADSWLVTNFAASSVLRLDGTGFSTLVDGRWTGDLIAPMVAIEVAHDVVVADAAAARLTRWRRPDPGGHAWVFVEALVGMPGGVVPGPEFSRLAGLASD